MVLEQVLMKIVGLWDERFCNLVEIWLCCGGASCPYHQRRPHRVTSTILTNLAFGLIACRVDEGSGRHVNEIFSPLGCCAVSNSSYLLTFRDNPWISFSRIKLSMTFTLKMGRIGCPETSVTNFQSTQHNILEEWISHEGFSFFLNGVKQARLQGVTSLKTVNV